MWETLVFVSLLPTLLIICFDYYFYITCKIKNPNLPELNDCVSFHFELTWLFSKVGTLLKGKNASLPECKFSYDYRYKENVIHKSLSISCMNIFFLSIIIQFGFHQQTKLLFLCATTEGAKGPWVIYLCRRDDINIKTRHVTCVFHSPSESVIL